MFSKSARNNAASTAGDAADEAFRIAETASDRLRAGIEQARRAAESAGAWTADAADTVSAVSKRGYHTAEDAIRIQPVLAVGAALVIGVAVGAILFARHDR